MGAEQEIPGGKNNITEKDWTKGWVTVQSHENECRTGVVQESAM